MALLIELVPLLDRSCGLDSFIHTIGILVDICSYVHMSSADCKMRLFTNFTIILKF